jgi:HK97 family phage portal protein
MVRVEREIKPRTDRRSRGVNHTSLEIKPSCIGLSDMAIFDILRRPAPSVRVEPRMNPRAASPENPSTALGNPDAWLIDWAGGGASGLIGPPVTEITAMTVSAVYRCAALISGLMAGLPLKIYRDDDKLGRVEVSDHKYTGFFTEAAYPGRAMSAFTWRELWSLNVTLAGNHYSVIRTNAAGRICGFEVAPPLQTMVVKVASGPRAGQNAYRVTWPNGGTEDIPQESMLHIPGLGFDGVKGASRIRQFARNAISMAKTLETVSGRSHENATRPSGSVELPPNVSPDGVRRMEAFFNERYTGTINTGKPLFLDAGSKFTPFQMSAEDLQTLESRRYQIADICRFFGVPPHLVGEAANTSAWGSGIEQLTIGFLIFTLEMELQRVEAELRLKLFAGSGHYPRFDRDALRALDVKTAAEANSTKINSGQLTPNEVRKANHMPALPGGDELLVNGTLRPLSLILKPPAAPPAPAHA